jgi:hypothetical protein
MEKVLGFWSKLFTKCVSLKDYLLMKNSQEESLVKLEEKIKALDSMRAERDKADKKCIELAEAIENVEFRLQNTIKDLETANNKVTSLENIVSEQKTKVGTITTSLSNEKERHEFTLKMLKEAQAKIESLASTTSYVDANENVVSDVCETVEPLPELETVSGDLPKTPEGVEYASDDSNVLPTETKVVKKDKLTSFIETLTTDEVTSLHQAILEAHKNDKRLYSTMQNWISKSDNLLVQTTNMFRTALNRKRGKTILNAWYNKYENHTSK